MKTPISLPRDSRRQRRRREDRVRHRQGTYTDDIKIPGTTHAAFVRSPFAHARIRNIDTTAARAVPGVVGVFTGRDWPTRRQPASRWMATAESQNRPAPRSGARRRAVHGRGGGRRHRRDRVRGKMPPSCAGRVRELSAKTSAKSVGCDVTVQMCTRQRVFHGSWGEAATDAAFRGRTRSFGRPRQTAVIPNASSRGRRSPLLSATDDDTLCHLAEPARAPAAGGGVRARNSGAQVPRHRARRRRRLRLEGLRLSRRGCHLVGLARSRAPGEVDRRAARELHDRCARPRSRDRCRDGLRCRR